MSPGDRILEELRRFFKIGELQQAIMKLCTEGASNEEIERVLQAEQVLVELMLNDPSVYQVIVPRNPNQAHPHETLREFAAGYLRKRFFIKPTFQAITGPLN